MERDASCKKVLEGKTKGYRNHPQLERFKAQKDPVQAINVYLQEVFNEAKRRGYNFDKSKVDWKAISFKIIKVTSGQIKFEVRHLLEKLRIRDKQKYHVLKKIKNLKPIHSSK